MTTEVEEDWFISEEQLEERLHLTTGALRRRRHNGLKLPCVRLGTSIRYHWPTVREYLLGTVVSKVAPQLLNEEKKSRRGRRRKTHQQPT